MELRDSFSINHTTPYAMICLQEMNLYTFYPSVFWNTSCLSVMAATQDEEDEEEFIFNKESYEDIEFLEEDEDSEEETKKKKSFSTNYNKIATAVGEIKNRGINVALPDINKSIAEFTPDPDNNIILYGLKGISNVSEDIIEQILNCRPFTSFDDFLERTKTTKTVIINLIKAGCFDEFEDRIGLMKKYIKIISKPKSTLNLRNFQGLMKENLIPDELNSCKYAFTMNKLLKENKYEDYFIVNESLFPYFENEYGTNDLENINNNLMIKQKIWDKNYYQIIMDKARKYIKKNLDTLLNKFNFILFNNEWEKYCKGNLSKWEMDSVSYYFNEHELKYIDYNLYGLSHFSDLEEEPQPIRLYKKYPIYDVVQIAGTVLSKDKNKSTVTILDVDGSVIPIKFRKEYFNIYDKQISELQEDGKKKVIEKSWFKRGNKIIVGGYRRGKDFIPKTYSSTPFNTLYNIVEVTEDNKLILRDERMG